MKRILIIFILLLTSGAIAKKKNDVKFYWKKSKYFENFHVKISKDKDMSSYLINQMVTGNKVTVGNLETGTYYVKVATVDDHGQMGNFSSIKKVKVKKNVNRYKVTAPPVNFYKFVYEVQRGDTFPWIIKNFSNLTSYVYRTDVTVAKTMEKNPQIRSWAKLKEDQEIRLFIDKRVANLDKIKGYLLAQRRGKVYTIKKDYKKEEEEARRKEEEQKQIQRRRLASKEKENRMVGEDGMLSGKKGPSGISWDTSFVTGSLDINKEVNDSTLSMNFYKFGTKARFMYRGYSLSASVGGVNFRNITFSQADGSLNSSVFYPELGLTAGKMYGKVFGAVGYDVLNYFTLGRVGDTFQFAPNRIHRLSLKPYMPLAPRVGVFASLGALQNLGGSSSISGFDYSAGINYRFKEFKKLSASAIYYNSSLTVDEAAESSSALVFALSYNLF